MKLQDFVKEQVHLLNKFEQHWEKRSLRQPEEYPPELASGDWDEQFHSFLETFKKGEQK